MMAFTIAWREIRNLFLAPLAWIVLGIAQLITGLMFVTGLLNYEPGMSATGAIVKPMFGLSTIVLLFAVPMLTMRSFAEERRYKTLVLLFSAPVSMTEIVLGKFLGVVTVLSAMYGLILVMALTLFIGTSVDLGLLAAQTIGSLLMLSSFCAIGVYMSARTDSPILAAVLTFGLFFLLWLIEFLREYLGPTVLGLVSVIGHYITFLEGIVDTADVIYYILFTALFLGLCIRHLDMKRLGV
jgi:ABC-2 type transport system permease protein